MSADPAVESPVSIIVPAHDEEVLLPRLLDGLTRGAAEGELDVIVVANACRDRTADVARGYADRGVRVIETPVGGKANALNLGDEAARHFPRFYVDADIGLTLDAVRKLTAVLARGDVLAAAPLPAIDLSQSSAAVRAFYDVWQRTPYMRSGMIGSGVYALSRAGRARFDRFPELTADDGFVRLHFAKGERVVVREVASKIVAPRDLASLIKIKTRSHFGNLELRRARPDLFANEEGGSGTGTAKLAANPLRWPGLAGYVMVKLIARLRARRQLAAGRVGHWERDDTSRQPAVTPAAAATLS